MADIAVLERQLGHRLSNVYGVGFRCKHGHPQALAYDPMQRPRQSENHKKRIPLDSSLFRLSCPLLVKAVDEWEAEGAVAQLAQEVREDAAQAAALAAANLGHGAARREVVGDRAGALHDEAASLGVGHVIERILESGVAGCSPKAWENQAKLDVKCLHAHLADHLCRSRSNGIGERVLTGLEARKCDARGGK